ncbi:MAG TPA: response regulator [Deltaproteobacteria bacterium]|nr:MAG: response regulator [Deltaproteobacteria bacterium]RLB04400.1 MAG: response regulator [Deltaproteobacteria bacterium]HDM75695.1 response regulator [Deltaproteobacteria bacterium]
MARLVVIDDEIDLCELIRRMFLDQGHEVIYFTDEDEALAWLKQENADLLIVDIQLRRRSGLDVLRQVKDLNLHPKVIIITAYPSIRTAKEAVSLGASDYLIKPVDIDELERKVNRILDESVVS